MSDFTHHTPRMLTEADAAADLTGLPRPVSSDTLSVDVLTDLCTLHDRTGGGVWAQGSSSHETVLKRGGQPDYHVASFRHADYASFVDAAHKYMPLLIGEVTDLRFERDALAGRLAELESEVLDQCRLNGMGAERELALMGRVRELEAERDAAHPTAGKWFCEDHPEHEMEHDGCKGAGIPEIARGGALVTVQQAQREKLRGAISDAAYEYSRYIVEDTAPRTLETYMLSAFDAALTTPESKP